jgi:hypothetical protein
MKKGVGLACIHYAVEVPKEKSGVAFLDWIGGYFEAHWSVNPHWTANFKTLPEHPITRGVKPFAINDEWYYHMPERHGRRHPDPVSHPPKENLSRPDGPHSETPRPRRGRPAPHVAWTYNCKDGGRGFGFTGGTSLELGPRRFSQARPQRHRLGGQRTDPKTICSPPRRQKIWRRTRTNPCRPGSTSTRSGTRAMEQTSAALAS